MPKSKKDKTIFFEANCLENNTIYSFEYSNSFFKSVKKHLKNKEDLLLLCEIIRLFSIDGDLIDKKFKAQNLIGNYK